MLVGALLLARELEKIPAKNIGLMLPAGVAMDILFFATHLAGKTPVGVARAAARRGIPVVAVAGRSTLSRAELAAAGIAAVYPLSDLEPDLERCRAEAARLLRQVGQMIARDRRAEAVTNAGTRA